MRCFCFPAPESDTDAVVENVPTLLLTNTQVPKVRKPHHSTVQYKSCGKREREKKRWSGRRRGGERAALQHVD